jgi:hypothetical protein
MKPEKLSLCAALGTLGFATMASAQSFIGSMGAFNNPPEAPASSYTSSSLTLDAANQINGSKTGTFLDFVPTKSALTAYASTISGLSATPLSDAIPDFFVFSSVNPDFPGAGSTTPANRFVFNLATITETDGVNGYFSGTGTLSDTQAAFSDTPGIFTLTFTGQGNYSFTLAAVPEPTTITLAAAGLLGALALRQRRKV